MARSDPDLRFHVKIVTGIEKLCGEIRNVNFFLCQHMTVIPNDISTVNYAH